MEETLICFGSEVKATDDGRVEGYLVRFSTAQDPDISRARDFFTRSTDFDLERDVKATVYFDHGLDGVLKRRKLGVGEMKIDDVGVWISAQLDRRDKYEKAIHEMAKAGKLGWSSGTAQHLVERKSIGDAHEILRWPLGLDASLTPSPAEPRNAAIVSLKNHEADRIAVKFVDDGDFAELVEPVESAKPAVTIKTIFSEVVAEQEEENKSPYFFLRAFERAFYKIREAGEAATLLATTVDFNALIDEAVTEFSAYLSEWAKQEFARAMAHESGDMMPSYLSIRTPLKTLVSLKAQPHAGLRFQNHSEMALAAVEEFASEATTLAPVLKAWAERGQAIQKTREATKAGRMISASNRNLMGDCRDKLKGVMTSQQEVIDALENLLSLAEPKEMKTEEPEMKANDELLAELARAELARFLTMANPAASAV